MLLLDMRFALTRKFNVSSGTGSESSSKYSLLPLVVNDSIEAFAEQQLAQDTLASTFLEAPVRRKRAAEAVVS